jgi:heme exporter protein B
MSLLSQTTNLIKREILLEQRQKYALYGVLLYVISTVFVCKFSLLGKFDFHPKQIKFGRLDRFDDLLITTWNSIFWIILLFASVTAIARSFAQESRGRLLYLYTLASPKAVFLSKLFYNVLLMIFLGFTGLLFYSFFVGFPVVNAQLFFVTLLLGCTGLASAFTMISAIASKAGNNFTLMAILGFPVILPMLLVTIKLSREAVAGFGTDIGTTYTNILIALNVVVIALAYLLFPYLWRD